MAKSAAKPVYALVGSDSFLQIQALGNVQNQLPKDVQRIDVDGERAVLADVLDELRSFSMFGGAKLVVVRDADDFLTRFREPLENYVASPSEGSVLVLRFGSLPSNQRIYKAIAKAGEIIDCNPPKPAELARWVVNRAKSAHGLTVTPEAADLMKDLVGADMGRIDNELAKLALSVDGGDAKSQRIGPERIAAGVSFQREQAMYEMTNELAAGNPAEALRRWRQLVQLDPSTEFRAVTWLGIWLENVRKALALRRKGMNPFAIAAQLRIWPRDLQEPFVRTAERLGDAGVARALDLLAEVDHHSKTGVGDAARNVERFILDLAPATQSRR